MRLPYKLGAFGLTAEYLTASRRFNVGDLANKKPSMTNIEASYDFILGGKNLTAAIGHQANKQRGLI